MAFPCDGTGKTVLKREKGNVKKTYYALDGSHVFNSFQFNFDFNPLLFFEFCLFRLI